MFDMNYNKCKAQVREAKYKCKAQAREAKYQRLHAIATNWLNAKNVAEFKIASDINGPRLTWFEKMSLGCYQVKMTHPIIWGIVPILFGGTAVMMLLLIVMMAPLNLYMLALTCLVSCAGMAIYLAIETIFIDSTLVEVIQSFEQTACLDN